ncbi:glycerate kinase [Niveispirillum sp. BGYR6]|uniref:glycerate kinase type-2 family protein n=1 Tax=Niveispirillum sp. BGYR6 TaxID=2971249 RepID=UPI0022B967BF|nr:glycerate kinase [Niveispirillum sp. BGYR6]MDG5496056.1 glycerate kinase [Niveispirillum sp. BGYR6]
MITSQQNHLRLLFEAALAAASPASCLPPHLPPPPKGRTLVIGAGKAAAAMAATVEQHWPGSLSGLVITRYGHGVPCSAIRVVEAAHPVPDAAGIRATREMLDLLSGLTTDDLVLCLLSGGGSALLAAPAPGLTLADKQAVTRALLRSGATIAEMNCLRKHLSAVKGGRLAQMAAQARTVTLLISDVPGDDPSTIASGPTLADPTTRQQALAILERYKITAPPAVLAWLADPASETPKGPDALPSGHHRIIATPAAALEAAAARARELGLTPLILGSDIEGDAGEVARHHAATVREILRGENNIARPCVLLSGGETSVTVRGQGRGGRNAEFLLALAVELAGQRSVHALAADTDGIDGSEDNAGAWIDPDILHRAEQAGLSATSLLANNDAYSFFKAMNCLLMTGPTRTNVNDFRAILID